MAIKTITAETVTVDDSYLVKDHNNNTDDDLKTKKTIYIDHNNNIYYDQNIKNTTDSKVAHNLKNNKLTEKSKNNQLLGIEFKTPLIWLNVISITIFHILAIYAFFTYPFFASVKSTYTVVWAFIVGGMAGFGVTAGAHRLWAHRSYKAKLPLRIILICCYAMAGQNRLYDWVRDHRVHHKFSETDADPHNANRGFFFAHVGWLMMRKHPDVIQKGRQIDMSDILEDPVVQFFERHFYEMKFFFCFVLPSLVPIYVWDESLYYAVVSQAVVRYVMSLNFTWLVNSAAHIWGNKPYDKRISPTQNLSVAIVAMGEGWHNYHHVFPWDYKAAELGNYKVNITTLWLDLFAKIGWAYDLKTPSKELVQQVVLSNGDGTHPIFGHKEISENEDVWKKKE